MSISEELEQLLIAQGFVKTQVYYCGSWQSYAVTVWKFSDKMWFASFAVRLKSGLGALRKQLRTSLNEPGLKVGGVERVTKTSVLFSFSFPKETSVSAALYDRMNRFAATLRQNGIAPADTCALSGAPTPDSLCFVKTADGFSYQPVCGSMVYRNNEQIKTRVEENESHGSYLTGLIGAILGMLVGVGLNLLTILTVERIYSVAFALVPIASMFGYKLLKGKMNKVALVIVLVLCLVAVLLLPYLELVYYLMHTYHVSLGEALPFCVTVYFEYFSEYLSELAQLLVFMALGILFAWRFISGQINSRQIGVGQMQVETLRPNPACPPQYAAAPESITQ